MTEKDKWQKRIAEANIQLETASAQDILKWVFDLFPQDKIALANSLSIEDNVLMDMMVKLNPDVRVFTLDTGRLFQETYNLIEDLNRKYRMNIEILFPESSEVQNLVKAKGPNSFYYSLENRKECCGIRKMGPLTKTLSSLDGWVCGLRKEQSVTRIGIQKIEWDESHGLVKVNPIADWPEEEVWTYIKENSVPYSSLYRKGFRSIGCQPCTRAIKEGEDLRAGRWWWEKPESKECGLHMKH